MSMYYGIVLSCYENIVGLSFFGKFDLILKLVYCYLLYSSDYSQPIIFQVFWLLYGPDEGGTDFDLESNTRISTYAQGKPIFTFWSDIHLLATYCEC